MSRLLLGSLSLGLVAAAALMSPSAPEPSPESAPESALRAVGALHPRLAPAGDRVALSYQGAVCAGLQSSQSRSRAGSPGDLLDR